MWTRPKRGVCHSPTLLGFGISSFRGLQSQKTQLVYIAESQNVKRCLVVCPMVIIDDHLEVEKGRPSLR
jgi:hypothetical protein